MKKLLLLGCLALFFCGCKNNKQIGDDGETIRYPDFSVQMVYRSMITPDIYVVVCTGTGVAITPRLRGIK